MQLQRDRWTPLTVTIETPEEAEILHRIFALVDGLDTIEDIDLYGLFVKLGEGLVNQKYTASGEITVRLA